MTDPVPSSVEPLFAEGTPPKKGLVKLRHFLLLLVLLMMGGVVGFTYGPWANPPAPANPGNQALQGDVARLQQRVEALETKLAALPAMPAAAVAPSPEEPKANDDNAANVARLQSDMVAVSAAMSALQTEVKATGATATEARDTAAMQIASVVAFMQLRDAASAGRGFADDLATLRDASKNDVVLQGLVARLEPVAAGAPTLAALRDEVMAREPAVAVAKGAAQTWWERVVAELQTLVHVRPLHGGESDAFLALESALAQGNGAAALDAFKALPADAQHSLADWQIRLQARQDIDDRIAAITAHFTSLPAAVSAPAKAAP